MIGLSLGLGGAAGGAGFGGGGGGGVVDPDPLPVTEYQEELLSGYATGLVALYSLDEASGTNADDASSNENDGTYVGSPTLGSEGISGSSGNGVAFGSGMRVNMEPSPGSLFRLSEFTISCWFKRTSAGTGTTGGSGTPTLIEPLVTKGRGESEGAGVNCNWFLGIDQAGTTLGAFYEESGGAGHQIIGDTAIDTEWHFAVFTYDGSNLRLYLDGSEDATAVADANGPDDASQQLAAIAGALNSSGVNDGVFNGIIDEVAIWDNALSAGDISDIYDLGSAGGDPATAAVTTPAGGTSEDPVSQIKITLTEGFQPLKPSTYVSANLEIRANTALLTPGVDYSFGYSEGVITLTKIGGNWIGMEYDIDITGMTDANGGQITPTELSVSITAEGESDYDAAALAESVANQKGFWPLDESDPSATVEDKTSLGLDGAVTGVTFEGEGIPAGSTSGIFGSGDYIRLEDDPPQIGFSEWTINVWAKRTGTGGTASTGTGGVVAEPILTKGVGESEISPLNMNWWIGWEPSGMNLACDMEDDDPGTNHPIVGDTTLVNDTWYMLTFTYDGATLKGYVNGVLDVELALVVTPESGSTQHACIGGAMTTAEAVTGFFNGLIAKAQCWNTDIGASAILALYNAGLGFAAPTATLVEWTDTQAVIQLADGDSIDDSSVISSAVNLYRDDVLLVEDTDYSFSYNSGLDQITIEPIPSGNFPSGSYDLKLNGGVPA